MLVVVNWLLCVVVVVVLLLLCCCCVVVVVLLLSCCCCRVVLLVLWLVLLCCGWCCCVVVGVVVLWLVLLCCGVVVLWLVLLYRGCCCCVVVVVVVLWLLLCCGCCCVVLCFVLCCVLCCVVVVFFFVFVFVSVCVCLYLCVCLGGHLQIHGDTEPSPVVLGEQATMEKTTQRFQKIATILADLNAEGLNVQTVNDLLSMYVGAASQHALRMSFVPEQEAQNFDRQVLTFWSRLIHRDITSQLFFLPLKHGGFGVGSAVQRHAAAPWRAWQSVIPSLMTITHSPDTDSLFHSTPILRAQLTQLQSTISQQMNKPTFIHKPLGAALRLQTTQKKQVSTIQRNVHKQLYNSLTDTPTEQAILLSQSTSHTGAHLMQPRSEAYEIEDRCFPCLSCQKIDAPAPGCCQPSGCGSVLPQQKCRRCYLQETSGSETPSLLWMPIRRWCGSQTCSTGPMSCRYHSITQWGQSIH